MRYSQLAVMEAVTRELSDSEYAALCDFVFNVSGGGFNKPTLFKVINAPEFNQVPFELRRWVAANKKELPGLKTRRENEIRLFFDNKPISGDFSKQLVVWRLLILSVGSD